MVASTNLRPTLQLWPAQTSGARDVGGEYPRARWFAPGRVYAGLDPVTGRDRYLTESVRGTDRAARKRAERALTRLQAEVDKQRVPETAVPLSRALDEWLRTVEIEESTRRSYVGYIERVINPVLGSVSIAKLSARNLETLYAELRRCRTPAVEERRPATERRSQDAPTARPRWISQPGGSVIGFRFVPRDRLLRPHAGSSLLPSFGKIREYVLGHLGCGRHYIVAEGAAFVHFTSEGIE
jgi:hypothetical protein